MRRVRGRAIAAGWAVAGLLASGAASALERLDFAVTAAPSALESELRAASVLLASQKAGKVSAQEIFADARAEYGSLLNRLYAGGIIRR